MGRDSIDGRPRIRGPAQLVWLYALAWMPYLAAYATVVRASMEVSTASAALGAAANGLPPLLLGWLALGVGRIAPRLRRRSLFFLAHVVAGTSYAVACAAGTWLLAHAMRRLETGAWEWYGGTLAPLWWQLLVCSLLYAVLAGLGHALTLRERLYEEENRVARVRELAARAELDALRARLDPHFLFNTLHALLALVRRDPTAAEEGLERFGDMMHYVLRTRGAAGDEVMVEEERDFIAAYIELQRLRLADRLRWEECIEPDALACRLPALTLQPLVENAIRHAVAPRAGGGWVTMRGRVVDDRLLLEVADDGPGADAAVVDGEGLGLELVRARLHALHGERGGLEIETAPGAGFTARVHLPAVRPSEERAD